MNLNCNPALAEGLTNPSQRVKLITEGWFTAEGYCLNCSSPHVKATTPGTPFRDHECPVCGHGYELKSGKKAAANIVQDGGYDSMMKEIRAKNPPALLLLQYDAAWLVKRLIAIHPVFLTPALVKKRAKPHIRPNTGNPYWMCDLNLTVIPAEGKIAIVQDDAAQPISHVRAEFHKSDRLANIPLTKRGWASLVLANVQKIGKQEFSLADIYKREETMHAVYPKNSHVRDKIRQQLQVLRDFGYLEFLGRGEYRMLR